MDESLKLLHENPEFALKFANLLTQQDDIEKYNNILYSEICSDLKPEIIQFIQNELKLQGINKEINSSDIDSIFESNKTPSSTLIFLPNTKSSFGELSYFISGYITTTYRKYMEEFEPIMHLLSDDFKLKYRDYVVLNINNPEDEKSLSSRIQKEILFKYEARNFSRVNLYKTQWNNIDKEFQELMSSSSFSSSSI